MTRVVSMLIFVLFQFLIFGTAFGQRTPTDVFYLGKGIDQSIVKPNRLTSVFRKERLSDNLNPRNVFQRAIFLVEEFNTIYENVADVSTSFSSNKRGV